MSPVKSTVSGRLDLGADLAVRGRTRFRADGEGFGPSGTLDSERRARSLQ